ncbi:MAG: hypothetical protein LBQ37_01525 [Elusimicrobiota bacterium]|jgi:hypothetical protein|nr:hypothetical protein [Elusimicrobiota bacterium]
MKKHYFLLPILAVFLFACSDPRLDMTNADTFEKSAKKITSSLSAQKAKDFGYALVSITLTENLKLSAKSSFSHKVKDEEVQAQLKKLLDGKTANEVIIIAKEEEKYMENFSKELKAKGYGN